MFFYQICFYRVFADSLQLVVKENDILGNPITICYFWPGNHYLEIPIEVFLVKFWMRHYLSPTMKPTMILTNQEVLAALDLGPVGEKLRKRSKQTTKQYIDGGGKKRYVGTRALKDSQNLCIWYFTNFVFLMYV